ncbi:MAG: undecaprenyl-diphosphate phosphatase [Alphaproteobacteria bacterium]|nr:undecaprenyl-diphosphate phosphatase [Alphaproteobacteria bacterium]
MTFLQAIFFAVIQGVSELFPVSSLGHAVILPAVLGWHLDQAAPQFLPFLVVLHVGTATALLIYFWREWWSLLQALIGQGEEVAERRHLIALLVIGTLPAVVLGFVFEHPLRRLFGSPAAAAFFLIINGFVLYGGEHLRRRALRVRERSELSEATWRDALIVGLWQTLAFLPGISRSGATIVGGLLAGLHHEDAARFSFLLATPVIAGAAVLEIPKLRHLPIAAGTVAVSGSTLWMAGVAAGITAYASTAFLMRYFHRYEENPALDPFAYYCWAAGALALLLLKLA